MVRRRGAVSRVIVGFSVVIALLVATTGYLAILNNEAQAKASSEEIQINSLQSMINQLNARLAADSGTIRGLNGTIKGLSANVTSLVAEREQLVSQANVLRGTIATYELLLKSLNRTVLIDSRAVNLGRGGSPPSRTSILNSTAKYAGFIVISATTSSNVNPPTFNIVFAYSSTTNNLSCQVVTCVEGYAYVGVNGFNHTSIVPILPGPMKLSLLNWSTETISVTVTISYYS